eukprot:356454-Chlamydomonas_euryale.AAC.7
MERRCTAAVHPPPRRARQPRALASRFSATFRFLPASSSPAALFQGTTACMSQACPELSNHQGMPELSA